MAHRFSKLFIGITLCCALVALALPGQAEAQGRYRGRRYSKGDVERIIKRVEEASDKFKEHFDRSLDRSRLDGTKREDRLNEEVKELESAIDNLRGDFDRSDEWGEVREDVVRVINQADEVNVIFRNNRFAPSLEAQWVALRRELNKLAGIYNVRLLKS